MLQTKNKHRKKNESENKTKEKSKGKGKSQKKNSKGKNNKRKAETVDSDEENKFCAYCKGNGRKHLTHNASNCYFIKNLGNRGSNKKPKYQNKGSKEFNALVKAQVQKLLKQNNRNKKKKNNHTSRKYKTESSGEE